MPWNSIGLRVAIKKNGSASETDRPSTDTRPCSMASSRHDIVRELVRLISSASTTLLNSGPSTNSKRCSFGRQIDEPTMSDGIRSLVNWMRLKPQSRQRAIARASSVFPVPGMPSIRTCPPAMSATKIGSSTSSGTVTTVRTARRRASLGRVSSPDAAVSRSVVVGRMWGPSKGPHRPTGARNSSPLGRTPAAGRHSSSSPSRNARPTSAPSK